MSFLSIVCVYCLQILEEIINNGLAINEDIYAALMMCNAISGDMSGAKDILGTMKQNGLTPTQTAYSALLSGKSSHSFESPQIF